MPDTRQSRWSERELPELFPLRPPDRPTWDQLPEACRQEARKLMAQLFIEQMLVARAEPGACRPPEEEADHE